VDLYSASSRSTSNALPHPVSRRWSLQVNSTARHSANTARLRIRVGVSCNMPVYSPSLRRVLIQPVLAHAEYTWVPGSSPRWFTRAKTVTLWLAMAASCCGGHEPVPPARQCSCSSAITLNGTILMILTLEWPLTQISSSWYHSTSNNSKTVADRAIFTMADQ